MGRVQAVQGIMHTRQQPRCCKLRGCSKSYTMLSMQTVLLYRKVQIKRHYELKHQEDYEGFDGEERVVLVKCLKMDKHDTEHKMGRKGKQTTFNQRLLVIFHHEKGKTIRNIADLIQMKRSTVSDIILRYKNEDRIELRKQKVSEKSSQTEKNLLLSDRLKRTLV
ncbi:hypothetical protein ANN_27366 [Periplaneta americana]|uniref:Paired domain-containing protein n=1 Tax=Periplaneta americana TaxID=6978 RepID=A0ABQ8RXT9_PERAM|nr:hypothetical protein ANN_27366 [Periplaneta americana]